MDTIDRLLPAGDISHFTPSSGNRCGHDPRAPRWFEPPEKHAQRPAILRKLTEKLQAYYRKPATILPSLNLANGSDRQQRSERREACLDLLGGSFITWTWSPCGWGYPLMTASAVSRWFGWRK